MSRADKAALDQTDADRAAHSIQRVGRSQEVVSYESPYALDREEEITADIAKRLRSGWRLLSIFPITAHGNLHTTVQVTCWILAVYERIEAATDATLPPKVTEDDTISYTPEEWADLVWSRRRIEEPTGWLRADGLLLEAGTRMVITVEGAPEESYPTAGWNVCIDRGADDGDALHVRHPSLDAEVWLVPTFAYEAMSQSDARWPYCADLAAKLPPKPPPRLLRKRRPAAPLDA